jgi:hypothetical protein
MNAPGISFQGIVFIDIVGFSLIAFILHLVRTHKLYVGYALLWFLSLSALMITVSIPPLLTIVTKAVGAIFPASALSLLAFMFIFLVLIFIRFIFLVLIFISVQLSALSSRQIELIQYLALKEMPVEEENPLKQETPDES